MSLMPLIVALFVLAAGALVAGLGQAVAARRRWRQRRRVGACMRGFWSVVFAGLGAVVGIAGLALLGYHRLTEEAVVAHVVTHALDTQRYSVRLELPDGSARTTELSGDQWQLDARVIKWRGTAVMLGATPLYRLDRLSGRYRDAAQARTQPPSLVDLGGAGPLDLWGLAQRHPAWLPWLDADFGSAAYLPMVDGGRFLVTLAPAGGLIARPADETTRMRIGQAGW